MINYTCIPYESRGCYPDPQLDVGSIMMTSSMTSSMETFSASLALCEGNPPVAGGFPSQRPVMRSFDVFLIWAWTNGWANNREAGDLRRHGTHCDIIVMIRMLVKRAESWIKTPSLIPQPPLPRQVDISVSMTTFGTKNVENPVWAWVSKRDISIFLSENPPFHNRDFYPIFKMQSIK